MKRFLLLFFLSMTIFLIFTGFSYTVAKERWQKTDFDTTVKLQDHISRKWDLFFSYFSLIGSVEVTILAAIVLALLSLIRLKLLAFIGWLLIIPASFFEVFGKIFVFHPGPPQFLHRSLIQANLPSFYIHTNYSYPSGHMTRAIFLVTVFSIILITTRKNFPGKYLLFLSLLIFGFLMMLTRVYLGEHWLSDVIGGSLLGLASGLFASGLITFSKKRSALA